MAEYQFVNNLPEFTTDLLASADAVIGLAAAEIERLAKPITPQVTSTLMNSIHHKRVGPAHWQVSAGEDPAVSYAAFQHAGMRKDGSHEVHNYSKAGTQKNYISDPAIEVYNSEYVKARISLIIGAWRAA